MYYLLLVLLLFTSCEKGVKKKSVQGQFLYRKSHWISFPIPKPELKRPPPYPWQESYIGKHPRITKEFFRCKGNPLNMVIVEKKEGKEPIYFRDCSGSDHHGLPLRDGKEFIYPILCDLLNFVQEKTGKKVVITTGHRCREHNSYCDISPSNYGSKHMIGAEVDFYVEGLEKEPLKVIDLLQEYYKDETFLRYAKEKSSVVTPPWYNKEIFIKLNLSHEGRDRDNQHPYPYISIQVRYDRDRSSKVTFDEAQAKNYLRY